MESRTQDMSRQCSVVEWYQCQAPSALLQIQRGPLECEALSA